VINQYNDSQQWLTNIVTLNGMELVSKLLPTSERICMYGCSSLMPRTYACAREKVWLHKSKSLGLLQNLKASNKIAKLGLLE